MKKTFNIWRVLAIVTSVVVLAAAVAWQRGYLRPVGVYPSNSLMVIAPYRYAGTWVFDDPAVGLKKEPFVNGIPDMINDMVKDSPNADQGFRLLFSAQPFPGHTIKLTWRRGDAYGNWYYCQQSKKEGWLCPGLFKYYSAALKELYARAEKK